MLMNSTTITIIILLIIGIILIGLQLLFDYRFNSCPKFNEKNNQVPEDLLALQFSDQNLPSNIYTDMFNNPVIDIGGYTLQNSIKNNTVPQI